MRLANYRSGRLRVRPCAFDLTCLCSFFSFTHIEVLFDLPESTLSLFTVGLCVRTLHFMKVRFSLLIFLLSVVFWFFREVDGS